MELKDRFHKIEEQSFSSKQEKSSRLSKMASTVSEVIHWKSDVAAVMSEAPQADQTWNETLDLLQKSLTQFLQLDAIQLNVLNLSDDGHSMTHELAVLFAQATELPFEVAEKNIIFRMIGSAAYLEVPLHPETKNLVKEAVEFSLTWNKRYQNQLKMNFSFLMGKATLKISYKSGTAQKKKSYIVHTGVTSEV
jgi:hypothetical protein